MYETPLRDCGTLSMSVAVVKAVTGVHAARKPGDNSFIGIIQRSGYQYDGNRSPVAHMAFDAVSGFTLLSETVGFWELYHLRVSPCVLRSLYSF